MSPWLPRARDPRSVHRGLGGRGSLLHWRSTLVVKFRQHRRRQLQLGQHRGGTAPGEVWQQPDASLDGGHHIAGPPLGSLGVSEISALARYYIRRPTPAREQQERQPPRFFWVFLIIYYGSVLIMGLFGTPSIVLSGYLDAETAQIVSGGAPAALVPVCAGDRCALLVSTLFLRPSSNKPIHTQLAYPTRLGRTPLVRARC